MAAPSGFRPAGSEDCDDDEFDYYMASGYGSYSDNHNEQQLVNEISKYKIQKKTDEVIMVNYT